MAISNTYQPTAPAAKTVTGSAVSNREDLSTELSILAPEQTPLLSLCSKGKSNSTFTEWTVDVLSAPVTTGIAEGADVTSFTNQFSNRARLGNYVQTFRDDYLVSNLQQAVSSVGPADFAQAEVKAIKQVKRNVEATISGTQDYTVENGAGTPYTMRGLGTWINNSTTSIPLAYRTPAASIDTSLTEAKLNTILASIFAQNGEMNALTLVAGTAVRRTISNFTRANQAAGTDNVYTVMQDATSKQITLSVSVYDSDFGMLKIVNANPACTLAGTGYIINPKYLGFNTLIPMGSKRLEDQGGGPRGYVDMTGTLVVKHPGAFGKVTGITNPA
jgi:hypothetical protein